MSSASLFSVSTPELLWQGGGENGKPDPVYSVDLHPVEDVLLTSGIDASIPPKGSVRVNLLLIIIGYDFHVLIYVIL
jgi:hypothetical protein